MENIARSCSVNQSLNPHHTRDREILKKWSPKAININQIIILRCVAAYIVIYFKKFVQNEKVFYSEINKHSVCTGCISFCYIRLSPQEQTISTKKDFSWVLIWILKYGHCANPCVNLENWIFSSAWKFHLIFYCSFHIDSLELSSFRDFYSVKRQREFILQSNISQFFFVVSSLNWVFN